MINRFAVLTLAAALGPAASAFAGSGWTLPAPEARAALPVSASDAGPAPEGTFSLSSVAALFDSPAASLPSADDLIGIWVQVAKVDGESASYDAQGLPSAGKAKLVFISAAGNPFSSEGRSLRAFTEKDSDEPEKKLEASPLSFDRRSARFEGSECRKLDGTHMLCRVTEGGSIRFEGYLQTKKGQEE